MRRRIEGRVVTTPRDQAIRLELPPPATQERMFDDDSSRDTTESTKNIHQLEEEASHNALALKLHRLEEQQARNAIDNAPKTFGELDQQITEGTSLSEQSTLTRQQLYSVLLDDDEGQEQMLPPPPATTARTTRQKTPSKKTTKQQQQQH